MDTERPMNLKPGQTAETIDADGNVVTILRPEIRNGRVIVQVRPPKGGRLRFLKRLTRSPVKG